MDIFLFYKGNKCDLESLREVEKSEAEALCSYLPEVLHVIETSAKDNINVDNIFFTIASELKVKKIKKMNNLSLEIIEAILRECFLSFF